MAWVEGLSLDRYVEQHLYQPEALLQLAAGLFTLVNDLERHGIAHGDLQHGNILLQGGAIRLVDYDGMFVPALTGRPSTELGLASFQHPRRDSRVFGPSLDRFSLLVICTGLCALASDPKLWYEFGTGDNLLFRRDDLAQPRNSALFIRLRQAGDRRVTALADMLATACLGRPTDVPLPAIDFDTAPPPRATPWWVTAPIEEHKPAPPSAHRTTWWPDVADLAESVLRHKTLLGSSTALVGLWALVLFGALEPAAATGMSAVVTIGYLIERYVRYRELPALKRRVDLAATLARYRPRLSQLAGEKSQAQVEVSRVSQDEAREKGEALRRVQDEEFRRQLGSIDIRKLGEIKGMPASVISNFRSLGINNLADMHQRNIHAVRGVGPKRYSQIRALVSRIESEARARVPNSLPHHEEARITSKHQQLRRNAIDRLATIDRELASLNAQIAQAEREFNLLHVPTFGHFLRHNT